MLRDPFALLRQLAPEFEREFGVWPSLAVPLSRALPQGETFQWSPKIDVFEKDNRVFTRVDLPGMKKEDVSVEINDGFLVLTGERKREVEESKAGVYRNEREYGSFYRSVKLPDGITLEDVKATFAEGVLEVSVPLPAKIEPRARKIAIEGPPAIVKTAA